MMKKQLIIAAVLTSFMGVAQNSNLVEGPTATRVHILSDCSGRIFMSKDLEIAARDNEWIDNILAAVITSRRGYGYFIEALDLGSPDRVDLKFIETEKGKTFFRPSGTSYFPSIKFSTIRTGGNVYSLMPPQKKVSEKLAYRANYSIDNSPVLKEDIERLVDGVHLEYRNKSFKGVNVLAELEYYIKREITDTNFKHAFVLITDGFVNSTAQTIWSPNVIQQIKLGEKSIEEFTIEASIQAPNCKVIFLETGGFDFDPEVGRTGEVLDNDVLRELWGKWAESAKMSMYWHPKWEDMLSIESIDKILLH